MKGNGKRLRMESYEKGSGKKLRVEWYGRDREKVDDGRV